MNTYEWDENKRLINIEKHSIDFVGAVHVFEDTNRIETENAHHSEIRYTALGLIEDIVIFLVYTYRDDRKRIISARRANKNEREIYYSTFETHEGSK